MTKANDILFQKTGLAGVITLNRPEALNAVTDDMLTRLNAQLDAWMADEGVARIIIKAVPGRAFSAGGDIRHLYDRGIKGDFDFDFFAREYALNARIATLTKPYIALVDGIAMGGGVGVSFHGSHVIGGDKMAFAMPEVGIGFFPDVGGSYLLSRLPGHLGLYLGLTGTRLKTIDALWAGLITHACPSAELEALESALCTSQDVEEALARLDSAPAQGDGDAPVKALMPLVNRAFAGGSVEEIEQELETMAAAEDIAWAAETLTLLRSKSPTSLKIAFRQIKEGAGKDIKECMRMEYRILRRLLAGREFYEGIRAAIIDKDNAPQWSPNRLSDVSDNAIAAFFEPLSPDLELDLIEMDQSPCPAT